MSHHRRLHCLTCEEAGIEDTDGHGFDTQINHGLEIFQKIAKHLDHFQALYSAFDISFQIDEAMGYGAERAVVYLLEYHPQPAHHVVIRSEYYHGDETDPDYLDQPLTGPAAIVNLMLHKLVRSTPYKHEEWESLRGRLEDVVERNLLEPEKLEAFAVVNGPAVTSYFLTLMNRDPLQADQTASFVNMMTTWDQGEPPQ